MQRGENEMTRERRLNNDLRGLEIARFTNLRQRALRSLALSARVEEAPA